MSLITSSGDPLILFLDDDDGSRQSSDRRESGRRSGETKPVKIPERLHGALRSTQREFKRKTGVEPSMGTLIEEAFSEDPAFREVLEEEQEKQERENSSTWNEDFMKL
jgi:hypothetical protein